MLLELARRRPSPRTYWLVFKFAPAVTKILKSTALGVLGVSTILALVSFLGIPGTDWTVPGWLARKVTTVGLPLPGALAALTFGLYGVLQWVERLHVDATDKTARASGELETSSGLAPQHNIVRQLIGHGDPDAGKWSEPEKKAAEQVLRHYAKIASGILGGRHVESALDSVLRVNMPLDASYLKTLMYDVVPPRPDAPQSLYWPSLPEKARLAPRLEFEDFDVLLRLWGARPTADVAPPLPPAASAATGSVITAQIAQELQLATALQPSNETVGAIKQS